MAGMATGEAMKLIVIRPDLGYKALLSCQPSASKGLRDDKGRIVVALDMLHGAEITWPAPEVEGHRVKASDMMLHRRDT